MALTDTLGALAIERPRLTRACRANLFGLQGLFATPLPGPDPPRDIDILFVGNIHAPVQRDRLPWLGRLAKLSGRWRVRIEQGIEGEAYRDLLRRSRIVFN